MRWLRRARSEGTYQLGGLEVRVSGGEARLASNGAIAGSVLTLDAAVRHAVTQAGIPLADAVRAATQNPADMLGLPDVGRLEPAGGRTWWCSRRTSKWPP